MTTESEPEQGPEPEAALPTDDTAEAPEETPTVDEDPLQAAEKRAAGLKDQLLRTAADFENYRRRSRREVEDATLVGRERLLKELLPIFDNLERATEHAEKATDLQAFANGIGMVMRQFRDTLRKLSIERIETVGKAFDPNVHEAIQKIATTEVPPGHVAAEIQGGYRSGDRLIRPALVVVADAAQRTSITSPEQLAAREQGDDPGASAAPGGNGEAPPDSKS